MILKVKHKHKWVVIKTIWPYKRGWGIWCPKCHTILNDGLPLETAQSMADAENAKIKKKV